MSTWARAEQQWRLHRMDATQEWHVIKLKQDGLPAPVINWLDHHVGNRGVTWIYPESLTMCFKDLDHATQFALIFT